MNKRSYAFARQPLAAFPDFVTHSLEIILGYGRAMQMPGDRNELAWTLAAQGLALAAVTVWATLWARGSRDRTLKGAALVVGFAWLQFALFKMGFVRQDRRCAAGLR